MNRKEEKLRLPNLMYLTLVKAVRRRISCLWPRKNLEEVETCEALEMPLELNKIRQRLAIAENNSTIMMERGTVLFLRRAYEYCIFM